MTDRIIPPAEQARNLRNSARAVREHDLDMAHRYELRACGVEQGGPLPRLHGYQALCAECSGDGWDITRDGPSWCRACKGRGELGSPQYTSGEPL
jgi:DnaJ-class molecular chaperone